MLFCFAIQISVTVAQDADEFLPPLSPTGEEIHDQELLTRRDGKERSKTFGPVAQADSTSEDLLDLKNQRFQQMQRQLQELSSLWEQLQQPQIDSTRDELLTDSVTSPAEVDVVGELPIPKIEELENAQRVENDTPEDLVTENLTAADNVVNTTENRDATDSSRQEVSPAPSDNLLEEKLDGPVDRFALATSLYAVGHYAEALQAIDAVQLVDLTPEEVIWLDYLRAGCHRRLGTIPEASRLYRRIVANPEADWVGELSRWWLDHISDKQKLSADSLTLVNALKQWEVAVNELEK